MHRGIRIGTVVLLLLVVSTFVYVNADEGMWPLYGLDALDFKSLQARGLELGAKDIFNENTGGLTAAIVQVGGGTGSFVSPEGLILTNHHVAFGALQKQSKVDDYVLRNGFHAATRAEEVPAIGYQAYITKSFRNVTEDMKSVVNDDMTDFDRQQAMETKEKEIIAEAEKEGNVRCRVAAAHSGMEYWLVTSFRIDDVRIVYAPPLSIGEFGGDIDNWMWPRHTGDFSFLRAYVAPDGSTAEYAEENVPFRSTTYLPISTAARHEGDISLVMGYPGRTTRYRSSYAIAEYVEHYYPDMIQTIGDALDIMQHVSDADLDAEIKLASRMNALNNVIKNAQGKYDGLRKANLVAQKQQEEAQLTAFIESRPELKTEFGDVLPTLQGIYDREAQTRDKDHVLSMMSWMSQYYGLGARLYRWSVEKEKPDMEREPEYMERNRDRLQRRIEQAQYSLEPVSDRQVTDYMIWKALRLPDGQRLAGIDQYFPVEPGDDTARAVNAFLDHLYGGSKLNDTETRMAMFDMTTDELVATNDPAILFARDLYDEELQQEKRSKEIDGALDKARPRLVEAIVTMRGGNAYPDANGTIRLAIGEVKSYKPRDAVRYNWFTTLSGVVEKETGAEPFENPEPLLAAYGARQSSAYFDPTIGDVPVNFLTTNDGTGGNSGSPILNGSGEIIGIEFDGNWEGIIGDFAFSSELNRTICVDSRYVLYVLDDLYHAENVKSELTIH